MSPLVSADEFRAYLNRSDVTNSDAARILAVSLPTIQNWLIDGVGGPAGRFIQFLISTDVLLTFVAHKLEVEFSTIRRLKRRAS